MASRRRFLKLAGASGVAAYFSPRLGVWRLAAQVPAGTLRPAGIPKFVTPLLIPPAMPLASSDPGTDYYSVGVRQFNQQILPPVYRATPVWGYGSTTDPATFNYPSYTIEAKTFRRTQVTWLNQLVDDKGRYLPHLLPVDQTLHWANPPGGTSGRDMRGTNPRSYRGPVPMVPHLHGGHTTDESDGYPEAWFLPVANNIPAGYATTGSWYDFFKTRAADLWGSAWAPGSAQFTYMNDQRATTLWFHDHALGITRVNVYAGPAGFYLIRGGADDLPAGVLPGPAPAVGDASGASYYEIPLAIQDRSFNADGSLFYPDNRAFFEGLTTGQLQIPFIPDSGCTGPSDVSPIWNPEFFGNCMVVNGRTWPYLEVEQRRYRFRFLNGCDSRFLMLKMSRPGVSFWQIGAEGGFLRAPVKLNRLLIAPAERADVIVDFTNVPAGTRIVLQNVGPDEPFGGGEPDRDFDTADPDSTGKVMQFRVIPARSADTSTPPHLLTLPAISTLPNTSHVRQVSLNEAESATVMVGSHPGHGHKKHQPSNLQATCGPHGIPFGPTLAMLGTVAADGSADPKLWIDSVSENPENGSTETWEIHNFTADAHPIHVHLVQFEVIEREANGVIRPPEAWESGLKDTVVSYPGEITRIKATFDLVGRYVWHCHILAHEDNEMMRPFLVGNAPGSQQSAEKSGGKGEG